MAVILVAALSALCIFTVEHICPDDYTFTYLLINILYWTVMILCLLQTGIFLISHYKRLYPRFLIAFTGVFALLFLILYGFVVRAQFRTWESYKAFMGNRPGLEGFDLTSCFIGDHTWFLVPTVLQIVMWLLLYRQQKQTVSKVAD